MRDIPKGPEAASADPGGPGRRWWQRLGNAISWVRTGGTAAAILVVVAVLARELLHQSVEIAAIAVPQNIADAGYSPRAVAQRLMDQITIIHERAQTSMEHEVVKPFGGAPDFDVPGVDVSMSTLSRYVAKFFGLNHTTVGGEIVENGKELSLYLRILRSGSAFRSKPITDDSLDRVISLGAEEIVRRIEPFILAAYYFHSGRKSEARRIAKSIAHEFASEPDLEFETRSIEDGALVLRPVPEEVKRAHNLIGMLLEDEGNHEDAIKEYEYIIDHLDPDFVPAHINLGVALEKVDRLKEAQKEYERATELAPGSSTAHNDLGSAYWRNGKWELAKKEFLLAIDADPKYALAHSNLADALRKMNLLLKAESEYRRAINVDPNLASAHEGLGRLLRERQDLDEAIDEIKSAIGENAYLASPHYELAQILWQKNKREEALIELRLALRFNPDLEIPRDMKGSYGP